MKVALLESSHWHVPLYLDALAAADVQVVAVSDCKCANGSDIARRFSARFYEDYAELLDCEDIDFAFTFGRHCDMDSMASALIGYGIPFALEKPCGLNANDVALLHKQAQAKNIFVSVPLIFRLSALRQNLLTLNESEPKHWDHLSFKFIAGPPERYLDAQCGWMLDKSLAGGGCAINLAVHFIDLVMQLTGEDITEVSARMIQGSAVSTSKCFPRSYSSPVAAPSARSILAIPILAVLRSSVSFPFRYPQTAFMFDPVMMDFLQFRVMERIVKWSHSTSTPMCTMLILSTIPYAVLLQAVTHRQTCQIWNVSCG